MIALAWGDRSRTGVTLTDVSDEFRWTAETIVTDT
jgi:hypothetical protein